MALTTGFCCAVIYPCCSSNNSGDSPSQAVIDDFVEVLFAHRTGKLVTPDDYAKYAREQSDNYLRVRDAMPEDERPIREVELAKLQEVARAYRASDLLLRDRKLLTFGSMLMDAVTHLRMDTALRDKLRARYRYLLVDEFQDTNVAQLELLWLLGGERPNLVVVGDHRQAIYRFRGASFGSFTTFLERFAGNDVAAQSELLRQLTLNLLAFGGTYSARGRAGDPAQRETDAFAGISADRGARRRRQGSRRHARIRRERGAMGGTGD